MILVASAVIWFGSAGAIAPPPPAHAAAAANVVERVLPSKSTEQIIDRYVRQHMFDDDDASWTDPLESAYREAYDDIKGTGAHPRALKEAASEVLGQGAGKKIITARDEETAGGVFGVLTSTLRLLERRGLSETTALIVIAGTLVIVGPSLILFGGMIVGGASKRSMNRLMKSRYGETYTVDATIKEEPDEEDEDEDDEDDDDDDDDDEDDDK